MSLSLCNPSTLLILGFFILRVFSWLFGLCLFGCFGICDAAPHDVGQSNIDITKNRGKITKSTRHLERPSNVRGEKRSRQSKHRIAKQNGETQAKGDQPQATRSSPQTKQKPQASKNRRSEGKQASKTTSDQAKSEAKSTSRAKSEAEIRHLPTVQVEADKEDDEPEEREPSGFATVIRTDRSVYKVRALAEVLRESAGVQMRSTGGVGSWSVISIRGSSSSQVQILLDGIPLNHGGGGAVNLGDLPVDALRQAEIYRGFAPPHLGGAIGGVVALESHYPPGHRVIRAALSTGSFSTLKFNLSYAQRWNNWQFLVFGHYLGSGGDFSYYDDRGTPLQTNDDIPDAMRQNNASTTGSLLARASVRLSPAIELSISDVLIYRDQGIAGIGNFRSLVANYQHLRNLAQISLKGARLPARDLRWNTQFYNVYQWERFADPEGEIGIGRQDSDNRTLLFGWKAYAAWLPVPQWEISLSSHLRREGFTPSDRLNPNPDGDDPRSRWLWEPALQSLLYLWEDRLTLVASGRFELLHNDFAKLSTLPGSEQIPATAFFPTGRVGLRFRPWEFIWLQSNAGRYVRTPTFWEMFGDRGTMIGNPNLRPEEGWMFDAGVGFGLKKSGMIDEARLTYAFFWTESSNLIRFIQNSQRTMIAINIDNARILGHEISTRLGLLELLRISADFTWMDAINLSPASYENGKRLPGRPTWEVSLRGEIYTSWGSAFYAYTGLGGNFLDRANLRELAPRHIHNLGFSIKPAQILALLGGSAPLWDGLTISFEIQNLLDTRVEDVPLRPPLPNLQQISQAVADYSGYPLPGRAFYLTVDWKI
jgi:iron complex outermembrane receptor protein